jgi:hypothetical protein
MNKIGIRSCRVAVTGTVLVLLVLLLLLVLDTSCHGMNGGVTGDGVVVVVVDDMDMDTVDSVVNDALAVVNVCVAFVAFGVVAAAGLVLVVLSIDGGGDRSCDGEDNVEGGGGGGNCTMVGIDDMVVVNVLAVLVLVDGGGGGRAIVAFAVVVVDAVPGSITIIPRLDGADGNVVGKI